MLRARVKVEDGEVPVELLSKESAVWQSDTATRRWLDSRGLKWAERMEAGPLNRHEYSARAWALANGFARELPSGFLNPDWKRLRDAGVPGWGSAELEEWFTHVGIAFDPNRRRSER